MVEAETSSADAADETVSAWDQPENAAAYARFCAESDYYRSVSEALVKAAQLSLGERVCDLGCGTGQTLSAIAGALGRGACVVAVDPARAMLSYAQNSQRLPGVSFVLGTSRRLPSLRGASGFDAVLCSSAAWLHPSRDELLSDVFQSLSGRGRLALSIPSEFVGESSHLIEPTAQRFVTLLSSLRTELGIGQAAVTPSVEPSLSVRDSFSLHAWLDALSNAGFARVEVSVHPFEMPVRDWAAHLAIPAVLSGLLPHASDDQRRQFVNQLALRCEQDARAARPWHLLVAWRV